MKFLTLGFIIPAPRTAGCPLQGFLQAAAFVQLAGEDLDADVAAAGGAVFRAEFLPPVAAVIPEWGWRSRGTLKHRLPLLEGRKPVLAPTAEFEVVPRFFATMPGTPAWGGAFTGSHFHVTCGSTLVTAPLEGGTLEIEEHCCLGGRRSQHLLLDSNSRKFFQELPDQRTRWGIVASRQTEHDLACSCRQGGAEIMLPSAPGSNAPQNEGLGRGSREAVSVTGCMR